MEFKDLKFETSFGLMGSSRRAMPQFANGHYASVIQGEFSYGGREGLYEIAVLDSNGSITYDTSVTNDVLGYLDEDDVTEILKQIEALPPCKANAGERAPADDE